MFRLNRIPIYSDCRLSIINIHNVKLKGLKTKSHTQTTVIVPTISLSSLLYLMQLAQCVSCLPSPIKLLYHAWHVTVYKYPTLPLFIQHPRALQILSLPLFFEIESCQHEVCAARKKAKQDITHYLHSSISNINSSHLHVYLESINYFTSNIFLFRFVTQSKNLKS